MEDAKPAVAAASKPPVLTVTKRPVAAFTPRLLMRLLLLPLPLAADDAADDGDEDDEDDDEAAARRAVPCGRLLLLLLLPPLPLLPPPLGGGEWRSTASRPWVCSRVFNMSSGVVARAATAPAPLPATKKLAKVWSPFADVSHLRARNTSRKVSLAATVAAPTGQFITMVVGKATYKLARPSVRATDSKQCRTPL